MRQKRNWLIGILLGIGAVCWIASLFWNRSEDANGKVMQILKEEISVHNNGQIALMVSLLELAEQEMKENENRKLTQATTDRLVALSDAFTPYPQASDSGWLERFSSPERGQLLQSLALMNMDTTSFSKIKRKANFEWADLSGMDLRGRDLSDANLKGANLSEADLRGAKLDRAKLPDANLWGSIMDRASLQAINLKRANLSWSAMDDANFTMANLQGAQMDNGSLRRAKLQGANLKRVNFNGAFLKQANLKNTELYGVQFARANLVEADLTAANLKSANMSEAILTKANLSDAELNLVTVFRRDWLVNLTDLEVKGSKAIQAKYLHSREVSDTYNYRIRTKSN